MTPTHTTLEVTHGGKSYSLEGDQMILFTAQAQTGRPFRFTFPGDHEPTEIDYNGLRAFSKTTVLND